MAVDILLLLTLICTISSVSASEVVYAVNCGGDSHVDSFGINYLGDPLQVGTKSDYGRRQTVTRAPPSDNILYQTERWHDSTFSYNIPVQKDGDYVLVLKFAEVYFYGPNLKVFNVQLNDHSIVQDLDIFNLVGHSTAYDEIIPLSIKKGKLSVTGEFSTFNGVLKLDFMKGAADNPKICAFYLMKGTVADVPKLPELKHRPTSQDEETGEEEEPVEDDESEDTEDQPEQRKTSKTQSSRKSKLKSGPPAADPYAEDSGSLVMPIMVAFGLFIPTVLCLCRL
uniref:Malectin-A n=1 Tax=Ciona intestinalis TaxID=7719 RepID=F6ZSN0_CIOIN|nr:malectin-A [Ciona intestinalis]|eukprot:XP_002127786.1 malectin-A [Ciona intestinalis]